MANKQAPDITVYAYGRVYSTPALSPFVLKLLTYLRMADVKYNHVDTLKTSSKGKIPFITYKGKEVGDSTFIINFLNKELNIDLDSSLSVTDKAVALAFQRLCEENLYWLVVYYRWVVKKDKFFDHFPVSGLKKSGLKVYATISYQPTMKANLNGHGLGRHSKAEVDEIGEKDLSALSNFLGDKQFFMGDTPTSIDCTVFGLLAQFAYVIIGAEQEKLVAEKYSNLKAYCDRMRAKYWPDWDELCVSKPK